MKRDFAGIKRGLGTDTPLRPFFVSLLGAAANIVFAFLVSVFDIPLYFDSVGTLLVAISVGLVPSVVTALITHAVLWASGRILFPFVICSLLTALTAWGFQRKRLLNDYTGYLWLGLATGLHNGVVGSLLAWLLFAGVTEVHAVDRLVMSIFVLGQQLSTSVFWAGLLTNIIDKSLSALLVFYAVTSLSRSVRGLLTPGNSEKGKPIVHS